MDLEGEIKNIKGEKAYQAIENATILK